MDGSTRNRVRRRAGGFGAAVALIATAFIDISPAAEAEPAAPGIDPVAVAFDHLVGASAEPARPGTEFLEQRTGSSTLVSVLDQQPLRSDVQRDELEVASVVETEHNDTTTVYVQQQRDGVDIRGAVATVTVSDDGRVRHAPGRLAPSGETQFAASAPSEPSLSAVEAVDAAAVALGIETSTPAEVLDDDVSANSTTLAGGDLSTSPIDARLVWEPLGTKTLRLAWDLRIDTPDEHWWQIRIDAENGAELSRSDLVIHERHDEATGPAGRSGAGTSEEGAAATGTLEAPPDAAALVDDGSSYRVFASPAESPNHTSPVAAHDVVTNPADESASPFGWHDTNGVAGAESTQTTGNNVDAGTDVDGDDVIDAGSRSDGGAGLDFDDPFDENDFPADYRPAAVTNLFYWNNLTHDFLYRYGFDEASGNFQLNNYGNGGIDGDPVIAQAQDGSDIPGGGRTTDNANFATPPDGLSPRMQMYVFTSTLPERDSDLDAGVIAHEYAHGLSTRLTGGPTYSDCLDNDEQMGEGWSDIIALLMTMRGGALADETRGIGTYVEGEPTTGNGIRGLPYSTDITTNPWTYETIFSTGSSPHALGAVWAQMLWEMNWGLIDVHGFDADLANGSGGNNIATQLIVDGLKLQPCSPGFVDGRDAIIQADAINNDGENLCIIWEAFAKRGLGVGAQQGSSLDRSDGAENFDLPLSCGGGSVAALGAAAPAVARAGSQITYTLTARNDQGAVLPDVVLTTPIPTGTSYVADSADCAGTVASGVLTQSVGALAVGATVRCSFAVLVDPTPFGGEVLRDDFLPDAWRWTASANAPTTISTWDLAPFAPGDNDVVADGPAEISDQLFTLNDPVLVTENTALSFIHIHRLENGFDGGVVEVSTDGSTWTDLGPQITRNGYSATIDDSTGNPIGGRAAFTGNSGLLRTEIDMSPFAGDFVRVRFRLATDNAVASQFWLIDSVRIANSEVSVVVEPTMTSDGAAIYAATARTRIDGPETIVLPPPPEPPAPVPVFAPITPSRLLDTRADGETIDDREEQGGKRAAGSTVVLPVADRAGIPADAAGVVINVTAVNPDGVGFVTVHPCLPTLPVASSLNYRPGVNLGNEVVAEIDASGNVCVFTSDPSHLVVDAVAFVPAGAALATVPPSRLLDTRDAGSKASGGYEIELQVAGRFGIPVDADAAIVNVTAINPDGIGFVTVHPCLATRPVASSLNYTAGVTRGNETVAQLDAAGRVCLYTESSTHLAVDVVAYLPPSSTVEAVTPARLLDTRPNGDTIDDESQRRGRLPVGETIAVRVAGRASVPADASVALVNVTAVGPAGVGFVTVFPCGVSRPNASSLNFIAGVNGGNDLVAGLGDDGTICLFASESTHLTLDVTAHE